MPRRNLQSWFVLLLAIGLAAAGSAGSPDPGDTGPYPPPGGITVLLQDRQEGAAYRDQLTAGWTAFGQAKTPNALEAFESVLNATDATEAERVQALYGIGTCHLYDLPAPDLDQARAAFNRIVDDYPGNPAAPWALLALGQVAGNETFEQREQARAALRRVPAEYPDSLALHEAMLNLARLYFFELDPELTQQGVDTLETHVQAYPDNPLVCVMLFRLVYWHAEVRRDYGSAVRYAEWLGTIRLSDPYRWASQYWLVGQVYYLRLHDPAAALPWYQKILDECPRAQLRYSAKQRVEEIQALLDDRPAQPETTDD